MYQIVGPRVRKRRLEKTGRLHYDKPVNSRPCIGSLVEYEYIDNQQKLAEFCDAIAECPVIGFDTEFISEDTYRPELCLVQVAAGAKLGIIDPLATGDVSPFWRVLAAPNHATIVHAGREEFRFCTQSINQRPSGWFDIQLAAGFVGLEYPAAYSTLISRLLGKTLPKGETRTDWRKRPLSDRQLEYALQDVLYLEPIRDLLTARLIELERLSWLEEDLERWQNQLEHDESRERWRRVSGVNGLSRRSLAIVRELWQWRDAEAQRRDCPQRRVLRDDLIVELARRKTADPRRIQALRGLERLKRHHQELAQRIQSALDLPDDQCPAQMARSGNNSAQFGLLGQFLNSALGTICRSVNLAPTLVGTIQDVRDLVGFRLGIEMPPNGRPPALSEGWRADVVGRVIDDLLAGRLALRVEDAHRDQPLEFVPVPERDA